MLSRKTRGQSIEGDQSIDRLTELRTVSIHIEGRGFGGCVQWSKYLSLKFTAFS